MKEGLRGKHYASDEEVKTAVMKRLKEQSTEFYKAGICSHIQKVEHCSWEKWWLCWEVGMWSAQHIFAWVASIYPYISPVNDSVELDLYLSTSVSDNLQVNQYSTRTSFILMYDICSCVGNYFFTKEKGITFWFTLIDISMEKLI